MRDFINDTLRSIVLILIGFLVVSAFLILLIGSLYYIPGIDVYLQGSKDIPANILRINAAAAIILTIVLVCVGWNQLNRLNRTSKADFLLRIDGRYGSAEIVKARAIIQRLYRESNPHDNPVPKEIYFKRIADKIDEIRISQDVKSYEDFSYLLNLLDFLEAISYFARKKYISAKDVDELIGNSIVFYFNVFKQWIYYRRKTYDNDSYYCEFQALVEQIESHEAKVKLGKTCFLIRLLNYFY